MNEMGYWRNIAEEKDYTQKKIEKTWNFYTMNINSVVAIFGALGCIFFHNKQQMELVLLGFLAIFLLLVVYNYKKNTRISEKLKNHNRF